MYRKRSGYRFAAGLIPAVIAVFVTITSCIDDPPTHVEINDYLPYYNMVWELYDQNYVGFDEKDVDWDALHDDYSHIVENANSYRELQIIIGLMIGKLEDRNTWFNEYPQGIVPIYSPDIEVNYDYFLLMELLEPWDFQWYDANWGNCVIDTIPYFAIGRFDAFFTIMHFNDEIVNHSDAPGMIIDIRMSEGLSLVPAKQITGSFCDQHIIAFLTQHRTGPGHDNLSKLSTHLVNPLPWAFTKPVVLLVGEQNTGAAEAFTSAMGQLSNITIIGDTTGGSGNIPGYFNQQYWPLWENLSITCPFARVLTADTVSIEGNGILPDIYVQTTSSDYLFGYDPVLEYAIKWIAEETAP